MSKQRIEYNSPVDALIAVIKRLNRYEDREGITSEEFFQRYIQGKIIDEVLAIELANDYRHYLALRNTLETA